MRWFLLLLLLALLVTSSEATVRPVVKFVVESVKRGVQSDLGQKIITGVKDVSTKLFNMAEKQVAAVRRGVPATEACATEGPTCGHLL